MNLTIGSSDSGARLGEPSYRDFSVPQSCRSPNAAEGRFAPDDGHRIGVGLPAVGMVTFMIVGIIIGDAGLRPPELGL